MYWSTVGSALTDIVGRALANAIKGNNLINNENTLKFPRLSLQWMNILHKLKGANRQFFYYPLFWSKNDLLFISSMVHLPLPSTLTDVKFLFDHNHLHWLAATNLVILVFQWTMYHGTLTFPFLDMIKCMFHSLTQQTRIDKSTEGVLLKGGLAYIFTVPDSVTVSVAKKMFCS